MRVYVLVYVCDDVYMCVSGLWYVVCVGEREGVRGMVRIVLVGFNFKPLRCALCMYAQMPCVHVCVCVRALCVCVCARARVCVAVLLRSCVVVM